MVDREIRRLRCVYDDSQKVRLTTAFYTWLFTYPSLDSNYTTRRPPWNQLGAWSLLPSPISKHVRFLHDATDMLLTYVKGDQGYCQNH
jgi:hypothetical protein